GVGVPEGRGGRRAGGKGPGRGAGPPVLGLRTWICAIAAPAFAASMAASAICCGVIGTKRLLSAVSPEPVTAQVTKTSQFIQSSLIDRQRRRRFGAILPASHQE